MSDQQSSSETPRGAGVLESHYWAMEPRRLAAFAEEVALGQTWMTSVSQPSAEVIEAARSRGRPRKIEGGVQRISLKGAIVPPHPILAMLFGIRNPLEVFEEQLKTAIADPDVGAVVLDVDSPGGVVDGIPEAAAMIRSVRGPKPIVAVANGMMASAAYWLGSQADEVIVTPSGSVGSIGVYATHRDMSGAMTLMGVKATLISAGKYKTEGNPYQELSDTAREHIQHDVDHFYKLFTGDVAKGRGAKATDVRSGYGEGRVLNAQDALSEGLVDAVATLGETEAWLASRSRGSVKTAAEAFAPEPEASEEPEALPEASDAEHRAALDALFLDDPVLAARALDKIGVS